MQRWEYTILNFKNNDAVKKHSDELEREFYQKITTLGQDGWELVSVVLINGSTKITASINIESSQRNEDFQGSFDSFIPTPLITTYYFKRPIEEFEETE